MTDRFITERLHEGIETRYRADKILFEQGTGHQHLVIYENAKFGRVMALDGVTQVTTRDEFVYHEMLAHVPLLAHGRARKVLIIGGGDGGILREVLRHPTVEKVTMVEIDRAVVDMCIEYLPMISAGAFDNPRTHLMIADGAAFVQKPDDAYDVMIVDSTDPIGPGEVLFRETFYRAAKDCLAPGGVLVTQNGVPFVQGEELTATMTAFDKIFASHTCYLATIPTYVFGAMALGWGSDDAELLNISEADIAARFNRLGIETKYYTPAVHKAAFALPPYVEKLVG